MLSFRMIPRRCGNDRFCKEFQVPIDLFHCAEWLNRLFGRSNNDKFNEVRSVSLNEFLRGKGFFVFIFKHAAWKRSHGEVS